MQASLRRTREELIEGHRSGEFGGHIKEVPSKIKEVLWNIKEGLPNVIRYSQTRRDFTRNNESEGYYFPVRLSDVCLSLCHTLLLLA